MVRIAFMGDVMLGRAVSEAIAEKGPEYPWGDTLQVLRQADIRIINLECPISERGTIWKPKVFNFRADPLAIDSLKLAGIDCVSLANNHILDYGEEAMADTIRMLDDAGIAHSGAGRNLGEAMKPAFMEAKGVTVGLASITDNMPLWRATEKNPGVNHIPLLALPDFMESTYLKYSERSNYGLLYRVRPALSCFLRPLMQYLAEAKTMLGWPGIIRSMESSLSQARTADFTILSCHWGPNWRTSPYGIFERFASAALKSGADMIHGHSAHLFQGIGVREGKPVLYDTGDFIDDFPIHHIRNDHSFIFLVDISAKTKRAEKITLVPVLISNCQANLAKEPLASQICDRMSSLCAEMGTETKKEGNNLVIEI
jgi:poly-gamma-glutamate synthesis protein (capsule biosynthesis protein)